MKAVYLFSLLFCAGPLVFGQVIAIKGSVKDDRGKPVPLAFVRDIHHYYATYTDSAGSFLIKADPASSLLVVAIGYADVTIGIENRNAIEIVMKSGVSTHSSDASGAHGSSATGILSVSSFNNLNKQTLVVQSGNTEVAKAGFTQEPTRGSPYLFDNWLHGFAVSKTDSLLYDVNNLYNYDKITGDLVFTPGDNKIMQVSKQGVKYVKLFDGKLYPKTFESAPEVSKKAFTEVLISSAQYSVYKQTETKLMRADFHSDGVIESGHRYDEYVDAVHYYFLRPGEKPKQISLKRKTLKELLGSEADKFITAQGGRDIDDDYLRELGYSLN